MWVLSACQTMTSNPDLLALSRSRYRASTTRPSGAGPAELVCRRPATEPPLQAGTAAQGHLGVVVFAETGSAAYLLSSSTYQS
jgi:hypothetical protein